MEYAKATKQIGFTYVMTILGIVIAPFLPVILVRTLTKAEYGVYSLFYSFVQLFITILELAFSQYVLTKLPGEHQEKRVSTFFSLLLANSLFFTLFALIAFIPSVQHAFLGVNRLEGYSMIFLLSIGLIFFGILFRLFHSYYFSRKEASIAALIEFAKNNLWIIAIAVFFLLTSSLSLQGLFLIYIATHAALFLALLIIFLKDSGLKSARMDWGIVSEALRFSLPLVPAIIAGWVIAVSDRYLINYFAGPEAVANYALPYSVLGVITTLGATTALVLYPYFIDEHKQGKGDRLLMLSIKYGMVLVLPAIAGLFVLREEIITLISGPSYLASAGLIPYLFLFPLFSVLAFVIYQHQLSRHKTKRIGVVYVLGAVFNIILNILLIPRIGIRGAAISTVLSYIFLGLGLYLISKERIRLDFSGIRLGRILLATLTMVAALLFLKSFGLKTYLVKGAVILAGVIIYAGCLFLLKAFDKSEREVIKDIVLKNKLSSLFRK